MDLSTLTMDAVRALDDSGLRRVVAELLDYRVVPCEGASNAGRFHVVCGDTEAQWCGRSVEEAWGMSLARVETWLNIPDYVRDLNAAVELLPIDWELSRMNEGEFYWCKLDRDMVGLEQANTPARAICLAWIAWRLAQQEAAHG